MTCPLMSHVLRQLRSQLRRLPHLCLLLTLAVPALASESVKLDRVPADVKAKVAALRERVVRGEIKVPAK